MPCTCQSFSWELKNGGGFYKGEVIFVLALKLKGNSTYKGCTFPLNSVSLLTCPTSSFYLSMSILLSVHCYYIDLQHKPSKASVIIWPCVSFTSLICLDCCTSVLSPSKKPRLWCSWGASPQGQSIQLFFTQSVWKNKVPTESLTMGVSFAFSFKLAHLKYGLYDVLGVKAYN